VKHAVFVANTLLAVLLASSYVPAKAENGGQSPVRLSADLDLTPTQQSELAKEAIKGSPEAALKLANFHFIVRGDRDATLKWYTIGAENGDAGCAYGLFNLLHTSENKEEQDRALFWLHKAADGGLDYAKDELRALNKPSTRSVPQK
jgi:TPR repeat protein